MNTQTLCITTEIDTIVKVLNFTLKSYFQNQLIMCCNMSFYSAGKKEY